MCKNREMAMPHSSTYNFPFYRARKMNSSDVLGNRRYLKIEWVKRGGGETVTDTMKDRDRDELDRQKRRKTVRDELG